MENLKPVKVKIIYNENLKKITGKDFEEAVVSENLNFAMFLNFIFSSYPEITKEFAPGALGFLLNGKRPSEFDFLKDGDELNLIGIKCPGQPRTNCFAIIRGRQTPVVEPR